MQNKLSDTLNMLMAHTRVNSSELARATGLPATTIKRMRTQESSNPTVSTLTPIAAHFGITLNELVNGTAAPRSAQEKCLPLIDWAQAANPDTATDTLSTELTLSPGSYAMRMEHAVGPFPKGAILFIDKARTPRSLDYVIVVKESGTASIKQYLLETNEAYLQSLIPGVSAIAHTNDYKILGVITQYRVDFN